jgi:hypothetical protein
VIITPQCGGLVGVYGEQCRALLHIWTAADAPAEAPWDAVCVVGLKVFVPGTAATVRVMKRLLLGCRRLIWMSMIPRRTQRIKWQRGRLKGVWWGLSVFWLLGLWDPGFRVINDVLPILTVS